MKGKKERIFVLLILCVFINSMLLQSISASSTITNNTKVTKENVYQVLDYLGVGHNKIITNSSGNNSYRTYTVGELKELIIKSNEEMSYKKFDNNSLGSKSIISKSISANAKKGTKALSRVCDVSSYCLTFSCTGSYSEKKWTGASGASCSVTSTSFGTVAKITSEDLSLDWDSKYIVLEGTVKVNLYVGIGGIGLIKTGSNKVEVKYSWDASKVL